MPDKPPHIILIMTDQQRWDSVAALGGWPTITPNLDRLARQGVSLDQCYCTAPSCVPSRASFFNARYPHELGVCQNADAWGRSWVERLQTAGYQTLNVGKMHTVPHDAPCGFDQRFIVENKDRPYGKRYFYDDWDRSLNNLGLRKPTRDTYRAEDPNYDTALGAFTWPMDPMHHPDTFVGRTARWVIEQRVGDEPMFLMVGFPGPHPPFDPPESFLRMYDDIDLPLPTVSDDELAGQPPAHATYRRQMIEKNHDAIRWAERPTPEQLQRLRRHYAANVTQIDHEVGLILEALDRHGELDNAVVVFTSDHGEAIGDHGHIQKWTMYDCVTRVPMLIMAPGRLPEAVRCPALLQHMDIVPMLLRWAGVEPATDTSAIDAFPIITGQHSGRDFVLSEHARCNMLPQVEHITMVRSREWKLVCYRGQHNGELYDLVNDPEELHNLWGDDAFKAQKDCLATKLDFPS